MWWLLRQRPSITGTRAQAENRLAALERMQSSSSIEDFKKQLLDHVGRNQKEADERHRTILNFLVVGNAALGAICINIIASGAATAIIKDALLFPLYLISVGIVVSGLGYGMFFWTYRGGANFHQELLDIITAEGRLAPEDRVRLAHRLNQGQWVQRMAAILTVVSMTTFVVAIGGGAWRVAAAVQGLELTEKRSPTVLPGKSCATDSQG